MQFAAILTERFRDPVAPFSRPISGLRLSGWGPLRYRIQWRRSGSLAFNDICGTCHKREPLHHSSTMRKAICCGVLSMYCDVASGFNFKIGHFLQLNRVEREKVTLLYDFEYNGKRLARLCSTMSVEPITQ